MSVRLSSLIRLAALSSGCLLAPAAPAAASLTYEIADLGTLGGDESDGTAISSEGAVVGYSSTDSADGHDRAFRDVGHGLADLGALTANGQSRALAVNASGHACGDAVAADGTTHAVEFIGGSIVDLNKKAKTFEQSQASGINRKGWMVGTALLADGQYHAWIYGQGRFKTLEGGSRGIGINNKNSAVGTLRGEGVVFNLGSANPVGTLGGSWSEADAVNDANQVTGWSATRHDAESHAFVWINGQMRDLGTLKGGTQSQGLAISDRGVIVGWSTTDDTKRKHAIIVSGGKGMTDLNDLLDPVSGRGWTLVAATGINASGQITGTGQINGQYHAYRLTPMK